MVLRARRYSVTSLQDYLRGETVRRNDVIRKCQKNRAVEFPPRGQGWIICAVGGNVKLEAVGGRTQTADTESG